MGCDTSFLLSAFLKDSNHARARQLLLAADEPVMLSQLNLLEFQTSIYRMIGSRFLTESGGLAVIDEFCVKVKDSEFVEARPSDSAVWERALQFSVRYSLRFQLCSLDVWQVAFAVEMGVVEFWSFDDRQRKLAEAVGLTINP